jgi:hypothetical protein
MWELDLWFIEVSKLDLKKTHKVIKNFIKKLEERWLSWEFINKGLQNKHEREWSVIYVRWILSTKVLK